MLKLRMIGQNDYAWSSIGRIRYIVERNPGVWLWRVHIHLAGGLPMRSALRTGDRHGRDQGGLDQAEGTNAARKARSRLSRPEHPGEHALIRNSAGDHCKD